MYDVIILGSGPAGLTAAIYTARARLSTFILTGSALGGQMALTDNIENYPGFPEGVNGAELARMMQEQAERFGAKVDMDEATAVDLSHEPFKVTTYGGEYEGRALIIATGASPRKLGVPGEKEFTGRGVSYCATCDGFFYRGKDVVVVGGGNSALEEALFLTRFVNKLYLVHRRDRLRADAIMQERVQNNEKIEVRLESTVSAILGDQGVTGVQMCKCDSDDQVVLPASGIFIYIGLTPNSKLFEGQIELNEWGFIKTDGAQHTNVPGVFAAGDVQEISLPQVATAVGTGARAAMEAERYLAEKEQRCYPQRHKEEPA